MIIEGLKKRLDYLKTYYMTEEQQKAYAAAAPADLTTITEFTAGSLNMSLTELIAIPEQEAWRYDENDGAPMFSAGTFVAGALRAYGVFGDVKVDPAEFTVKDIYELNIYDREFKGKPDLCIEADYSLDYCQLFGSNRLELPGYSMIDPYENMN